MESTNNCFESAQTLLAAKYKLNLDEIYNVRKDLHKHAELDFKEFETRKILLGYLNTHCKLNIDNVPTLATTGFIYDLRGTGPPSGADYTIGFRAEMDGLSVQEQNTFSYSSINKGVGHMCGHDGHMATLLGLAKIITEFKDLIPSNKAIRLIFQPAEEEGNGANEMIKQGALEGVHEVYSFHNGWFPFGTVAVKEEGPMSTRMVSFKINVKGTGSHGAYPEKSNDPITTICHIDVALHTITALGIPKDEFGILTIGEIHSGNALNVIPSTAMMSGSIRTEKEEIENEIKKRLERIVKHTSESFGCEGTVEYIKYTPEVVNYKEQGKSLIKSIKEVMGKDSLIIRRMDASEDFSFMSKKVPGAYMIIGYSIPGEKLIPNHNPCFDYNEKLIAPTILIWIKLIEERLGFKFF